MPRAYSEDLRKRVVAARRSGRSVSAVSATFGVHRNCVYRWDAQERSTGSLAAGYDRVTGRAPLIGDLDKFEEFARRHAHLTLKQMQAYWEEEVSEMTLSRALKRIGWSRKKNLSLPRKRRGGAESIS